MKRKISLSCIVPFYNEKERVISVLNSIIKIDGIDEVVCVDDGSEDNTRALIRRGFPNITVIRLNKNKGKSAAVKSGFRTVKSEYLFLIDADMST